MQDIWILGYVLGLVAVLAGVMVRRRAPASGRVLVIFKQRRWQVARGPVWLLRPFHPVVELSVAPRTVVAGRSGRRAVTTRDGARLDLLAEVAIEVDDRDDAIVKLARSLGGLSDDEVAAALVPLIAASLGEVAGALDVGEIDGFRDNVNAQMADILDEAIGGLRVESVAVTELERARPEVAEMGPFR